LRRGAFPRAEGCAGLHVLRVGADGVQEVVPTVPVKIIGAFGGFREIGEEGLEFVPTRGGRARRNARGSLCVRARSR
jgi:hypothetical protein